MKPQGTVGLLIVQVLEASIVCVVERVVDAVATTSDAIVGH